MSNKINYEKMWKTLLRTGIKERFQHVRSDFFMGIATNSDEFIVKSLEKRDEIFSTSNVFKKSKELLELAKLAIPEGIIFKHHKYSTSDNHLVIEYFANISQPLSSEYLEAVLSRDENARLDGACSSVTISETHPTTHHLIVINEGGVDISANDYPVIIKHELTHVCLYELSVMIKNGQLDNIDLPETWSESDINSWLDDIKELGNILDNPTEENINFVEFICEFLMFEGDGVIKVRNNKEINKKTKEGKVDNKIKFTYRTLTPIDRFNNVIENTSYQYYGKFNDIIKEIGPLYNDYDKLLEEVRI